MLMCLYAEGNQSSTLQVLEPGEGRGKGERLDEALTAKCIQTDPLSLSDTMKGRFAVKEQ